MKGELVYRDGLGGTPNIDNILLIKWYLASLLPPEHPALQLTLNKLPDAPSAVQQDSHSCGIVYLDALTSAHAGGIPWHRL